MWSCNGSASPAVCPERRVLLIVTLLAARGHPGSGTCAAKGRTLSCPGPPIYVFGFDGFRGTRLAAARVAGFGAGGVTADAALPGWPW